MRGATKIGLLVILATVLVLSTSARFSNQITGLDDATFEGREVLVLRTSGFSKCPGGYNRDLSVSTVSFLLRGVGADGLAPFTPSGKLMREVVFEIKDGEGVNVIVTLSDSSLVNERLFRLSQPSDHVILFEVFPDAAAKNSAGMISDMESQLGISPKPTEEAEPNLTPPSQYADFNPDNLGITSIDLSSADPQRVLGLASAVGLLNIRGGSSITTEKMGSMDVKPAGLSLVSWGLETPPSELYLSGTSKELAEFLSRADLDSLETQPTFTQVWEANKPRVRLLELQSKSVSSRSGMRSDPYSGIYVEEPTRTTSGGLLSDIRVSLPAMNGLHLYDVLNYLSKISGISIVIDPYTFDDPTGMFRPPLPPENSSSGNREPGFRPADVFDPTFARSGTVMGNFDNVPFDTALRMILETHGLRYVVYDSQSSRISQSSGRKVTTRGGGKGSDSNYHKPIILITSPERLENELAGQNEVNLQQFHYADPYQIAQILDNLNMRNSTSGWYIYNGGGSGGFGGSGGRGGSGGGGGNLSSASVDGGLLVFRGSSRNPIYDVVSKAIAQGESVIRVVLAPDTSGQFVTAYAS